MSDKSGWTCTSFSAAFCTDKQNGTHSSWVAYRQCIIPCSRIGNLGLLDGPIEKCKQHIRVLGVWTLHKVSSQPRGRSPPLLDDLIKSGKALTLGEASVNPSGRVNSPFGLCIDA